MMRNDDFESYDRITDTLMYLNNDITLNFTVTFAKKNRVGGRQFYHYETEYEASKYSARVRSIKRNMTYFFVIDNKQDFGNGFILRPMDVEMLNSIIETQILPWYFDANKRAFQMIDDRLVLGQYEPVIYAQSQTKYLRFDPVVYSYENGTFKEGIKIEVNKYGVATLDIDRFMGFVNILKTDMYCAAAELSTYTKCPPYGINPYRRSGLGGGKPADTWGNTDPTTDKSNYTVERDINNPEAKGYGKNSFLENAKKKG